MKQFNIAIARDSSKIVFTYKKRNPGSATGDYFDNASVTAASLRVINTETDAVILSPQSMSYSSTIRGYRLVWTYGANLDGVTAITVEVTPTRAPGVSATLTPIDSEEFEVADTLQRIDELAAATTPGLVADAVWGEATAGHATAGTFGKLAQDTGTDVASMQADFDAFEVVNQNEHDATQSAVAQIGATAEAQLIGPTAISIPDSGTVAFVLDFVLKDGDSVPTALMDPDSNIVDVTALDQAGAAPTGLALTGTPAGRMTRNSLGRYQLGGTVSSAAIDGTQVRLAASYTKAAIANVAVWTLTLGDFDQLDSIETQVNAIRTTDVSAIQANIDAAESSINANVDAAEASINSNVDAEHVATRALVTVETGAIDADIALVKGTGFNTATDSLVVVSDGLDTLASSLSTLQSALAAFEATLKAKAAGSYDRETDSMEALREAIDAVQATVAQRLQVRLVS